MHCKPVELYIILITTFLSEITSITHFSCLCHCRLPHLCLRPHFHLCICLCLCLCLFLRLCIHLHLSLSLCLQLYHFRHPYIHLYSIFCCRIRLTIIPQPPSEVLRPDPGGTSRVMSTQPSYRPLYLIFHRYPVLHLERLYRYGNVLSRWL